MDWRTWIVMLTALYQVVSLIVHLMHCCWEHWHDMAVNGPLSCSLACLWSTIITGSTIGAHKFMDICRSNVAEPWRMGDFLTLKWCRIFNWAFALVQNAFKVIVYINAHWRIHYVCSIYTDRWCCGSNKTKLAVRSWNIIDMVRWPMCSCH